MALTVGIDVGTGAVKTALFEINGDKTTWIDRQTDRIRNRQPFTLAENAFDYLLEKNGYCRDDIDYIATTGDAESIPYSTGHFYSMTTHARGALYLNPNARSLMDIGALNGKAISMNDKGKVLKYKMTSQCASGSGQFLENIARYLGIGQDEIGGLSKQADDPEVVSGICAVLAETDVINMVSRSISAANILKGIHISMAGRLIKLLKSLKVTEGVVMCTGGLALDSGLVLALNEAMARSKMDMPVVSHEDSIYAGAIGAAIWGAFRHEKLAELGNIAKAS
ncbi:Benzoyl-CoA reductase subunit D [hydrothermal vent metagenome]|uniref:Benzoyl-CoA reductase subunit D n=1 Tax=hydrothermal vent metagenome TaxID=652676 RepID=A0A3B1AZ38_9ZZZZ